MSDSKQVSDMETKKRARHNFMEAERRKKLGSSFQELREVVPTVANDPKTSRVVILKQAKTYIEDLKKGNRARALSIQAMKQEVEHLNRQGTSVSALDPEPTEPCK